LEIVLIAFNRVGGRNCLSLALALIATGWLTAAWSRPNGGRVALAEGQALAAADSTPSPELGPTAHRVEAPATIVLRDPAPVNPARTQALPARVVEARVGLSDGSLIAWLTLIGGALGLLFLVLVAAIALDLGPAKVMQLVGGAWAAARQNPAASLAALVLAGSLAGVIGYFLPVVPLTHSAALSGELRAVFAGLQDAHRQIACEGADVSALAAFYADTADYGQPGDFDRQVIIHAFGEPALNQAGLLTAKQAFYTAYFRAADPVGIPATGGEASLPPVRNDCAAGGEALPFVLSGQWVNGRRDAAIVTLGGCGTRAALLRPIAGKWKIVRLQELLRCRSL
jgi:hypothetical protein